ncbi:phosphate ABC transporter permease subunit PstC [Ahrensia sp. 13_GOM-1096m]|uniref:phosphate ABC transporter permease subunit PstC n=1 Tax=Ahrensia sp. 13_GOM-1096m TaxID=1380380 RepID=UPI000479B8EB|nr:phosphate ABC transporter permease subunit PstC [Ahrensia sp. 13_GOM-1096m]
MSLSAIILVVVVLGVTGWFIGVSRSKSLVAGNVSQLHSRPTYYGSYIFVWAVLPAALVAAIWSIASPIYIDNQVRGHLPAEVMAQGQTQQNLSMNIVQSIARGLNTLSSENRPADDVTIEDLKPILAEQGVAIAGSGETYMIASARQVNSMTRSSETMRAVVAIGLSLIGFVLAYMQITAKMRARNKVEGVVTGALIVASSIAILTTVGIVFSMLSETTRFFSSVPMADFFFGVVWDPRFANASDPNAAGQFGLIPLLAGTLYIAFVAMLVAVPVGLFSAIYMAEYAGPKLRSVAKPLLEVLAGIPTIVYGFFALVTVGPFLRDLSAQISGIVSDGGSSFIQAQSVLTAGFVMGIMLIPFVSSLSDDIITQVPGSMRDGSLGLGATRSETVRKVILPAALPGVVGALLLTASRAIGETMIVVLAAGVAARLTINPFEPMTTVTVKIVSQLTGDLEFNSPQTLVAFALGLTLFFITLALNVYALYIVRKYREQYE